MLTLVVAAIVLQATVAGQSADRAAAALKPQQTEGVKPAPSDFDADFSGTIGQHAIEANISRRGAKLEGQYFYAGARAAHQRQYLSLDGEVGAGENFTLYELDQQNQKTGIFKGRIAAARGEEGSGKRLEGHWLKSDAAGAPTLMFSLSETTLMLNGQTLRSQTKQISQENLRPQKYAIAVEYPEFTATTTTTTTTTTASERQVAAVNRAVLDSALKEVSAFKADMKGWDTTGISENQESSLNIEHQMTTPADGLVSISFRIDTYFAGAAHPNHRSSVINFDLRSGRQLKLADLFHSPSNYLQKSRACAWAR
ncbi:MAG: hypothetical protein WKF84_22705 [Pyrinomonadaceae bacterium]